MISPANIILISGRNLMEVLYMNFFKFFNSRNRRIISTLIVAALILALVLCFIPGT